MALCLIGSVAAGSAVGAAGFFVAPDGDDAAAGTKDKPFATLQRARDAVRALLRDGPKADVVVRIRAGSYLLAKPVEFGPEDSGRNGFRVVYRNADAIGSARFVGAKPAKGWTRHKDNIWKKTGVTHIVGTLYEDGRRAYVARTPNRKDDPQYPGAMAPYVIAENGTWQDLVYPEGALAPTGWTLTERARVVWWGQLGKWDWGQRIVTLLSVDAENRTLRVKQRKHKNDLMGRGDRFFVQNIVELLDAPGEFFQDVETATLYYIPRSDDPNKADVRIPDTTALVVVRGTDRQNSVHDLVFSGLAFAYTNWGRFAGKKDRGAVDLGFCHRVRIENCDFHHLGHYAVFGRPGTRHCAILNCRIRHAGEGGILIANRSTQRREKPDLRNEFNRVSNCLIRDLGDVYLQSCHNGGVMLWNANDCRVSHCDIARNLRYATSLRGHYSSQWQRDGKDADNGTHRSLRNVFQYIRAARVGTDSGDMGAVHAAHVNEPLGGCVNTWRQIIVRNVHAHPSMKDWPPNGIFVDHPRSCQKQVFLDFDIADTQGKPFRDNHNPTQTFLNVSWQRGFDRSRMQADRIGLTPEFPKEYGGKGNVDNAPPSPDPVQWADKGRPLSDAIVRLEAKPCTDDVGGVEYFFDCLTPGGHDSGWQVFPVYTDRGLEPEMTYKYRVKARDTAVRQNETNWSDVVAVATLKKSEQPCVAHYPFEKNARDAMRDHHGTVTNGAAFADHARQGDHALSCNGGGVSVPDHADLDIGQGDFALSLWFLRREDPRNNLRLLSKYNRRWIGYCIRGGDSIIGFDLGAGGERPHVAAKTGGPGAWHHLAVNVDRAGEITLYLNGRKAGSKSIRGLRRAEIDSEAPLSIGTGENLPWKGMIDDVRLYKRTLSDEEIRKLAGPKAKEAVPQAGKRSPR
jgi:hypothetical protein